MADSLVEEILSRVHSWQGYAEQYLLGLVDIEERYLGLIGRQREGMGWANVNDLEFYNITESGKSASLSVLTSDDPRFWVKATSLMEGAERKAAASQAMLERDYEEAKGDSRIEELLDSWILRGTCIGGVGWQFRDRAKVSTGAGGTRETTTISYRDSSALRPIEPWFFAFEPGPHVDIQDAGWVIEERRMSRKQIRALIAMARTLPGAKVRNLSSEAGDATPGDGSMGDQIEQRRAADLDLFRQEPTGLLCRFFFGHHPVRDDAPPVSWIVTVNDDEWIIDAPNPFHHGLKPYVFSALSKRPGHLYGLGTGHVIGKAHEHINEVQNLVMDLSTMALYGILITDGVVPVDPRENLIKPGAILTRKDLGGKVEWLHPRLDGAAFALSLLDRLTVRMRVAGAAAAQQQALPSGAELATEVKLLASEAARRTIGRTRRFGDDVVRPYLFMAHELIRQFQSRDVLARFEGAPEAFSPADLLPDPDIQLKLAGDLDNRPAMLQRLGRLVTAMAQVSDRVPSAARYLEPAFKRMMALGGVDIRNLPEPEPVAPAPAPGGVPSSAAPPVPGGVPQEEGGLPVPQPGPGQIPADAVQEILRREQERRMSA